MLGDIHRTIWNPNDIGVTGYWGEPNSSIDWCEPNYHYSRFVAEMFNTVSNLTFVILASWGIKKNIEQRLPKRFVVANLGLMIVGIGSALFHSTLLYSWQLGDELPMIIVSTIFTWIVFDVSPINSPTAIGLPAFLLAFNIAFIWAYLNFPNPVFHQVCYGMLVVATTLRGGWLLFKKMQDSPEHKAKNTQTRKLQLWGSISFLFAFFLWNCDNLLCTHSIELQSHIIDPFSSILNGHMYWHIFTGLGVYTILIAFTLVTMGIRDSPDNYCIQYSFGFLPWVARTELGWSAIGETDPAERTKLLPVAGAR